VRTYWHGNTYHLRKAPVALQKQPTTLDWAHFLGRLKWRDYDPQQYFNWRAYLDFGGGQITDLFTHWIDVVHMFMGKDIPTAASATGGVLQYKDGRTAPDTISVGLDYSGEFIATFDATLVPGARGEGIDFYGTQGSLFIDRSQYIFRPVGRNAQPVTEKAPPGEGTNFHIDNFLECVQSRKLPLGDVLIGHRSAQASHLGNISYTQRRRIDFDPIREEILPL
jgi:predicted dehydrogenase